ncbi:MAG: hypothetical protein ACTSUE_00155, partial [Promethearchaeota archaeon]
MSSSTDEICIRDVFDKERDPLRELNTIVKVFDESSKSIWTEFEEFVVTEALLKYMHQYFTDFSASIAFDEPKMPFWLEGFYGSGKSHFCKVMGHIFQNSPIMDPRGKEWHALDYFIENILKPTEFEDEELTQIKEEVISGLQLFPKQFQVKTIFINLSPDTKSETRDEEFMESFTSSLLKGFNKFLDLSEFLEIAEIEKSLISKGIFDQFIELIEKEEGEKWTEIRKSPEWVYVEFPRIYAKINDSDEAAGERFLKGIEIKCQQKTILTVLEEINKWAEINLDIPDKGIIGKVMIVLDEAGLFFSTKSTRIGEMMSAAEWINTSESRARINMIFSAQQSIKTYFENMKDVVDYKTAEQRFKHWLLDKKNIKTVVVRRWLKKDDERGTTLQKMIDNKWHAIKDGAVFDTIKDPNQEYIAPRKEDLYETYPFIPYHFPLIIQVTQTLIREKLVEELYGGRTRSILVMVRDVLNNKLGESSHAHFIEENLGKFVTLPQLYDTIILTLKRKDEDQFNLVENTNKLIEDPSIFSEEERAIPIGYLDVAKTVLLMGMISTPDSVSIPVDDGNIMKALFYSLDLPKNLFSQKIKKLISELKKKGYLVYKKNTIKDKDGKEREVDDYGIPSPKVRKEIERAQKTPVTDTQIQAWLEDFFKQKEGKGKSLIEFKKEQNLPSILGPGNKVIDLERAIKLNLDWNKFLDISIDEVMGKLPDDKDTVSICVLTNRTIEKFKDNTRKLTANIKAMTKRAMDSNKLLVFITPNLSRTPSDISQSLDTLNRSIKGCIRYQEALKKDMDGDVQHSFNQWVIDLSKEILGILKDDFEGGSIFYADKEDKIDSSKINDAITSIIKKIFSWSNTQAYLGQVRTTKDQLKFLLTWDPKKKASIPTVFKKTDDWQGKNIPLFDGNDLKPN